MHLLNKNFRLLPVIVSAPPAFLAGSDFGAELRRVLVPTTSDILSDFTTQISL